MKFRRGSPPRSTGCSAIGTMSWIGTTRSRKRASTRFGPARPTVAVARPPDRSIATAEGSAGVRTVQRVTSSTAPSSKRATTRSGDLRPDPIDDPAGRLDLKADQPTALRSRRTLGDPAAQPFGRRPVGGDPEAAAVLEPAGRLAQQQALVGTREVDAPALQLVDDRLVIERRVAAQQREPEPAPPDRRAVARTGVAPRPGEHGDDLGVEVDGPSRAERRGPPRRSAARSSLVPAGLIGASGVPGSSPASGPSLPSPSGRSARPRAEVCREPPACRRCRAARSR